VRPVRRRLQVENQLVGACRGIPASSGASAPKNGFHDKTSACYDAITFPTRAGNLWPAAGPDCDNRSGVLPRRRVGKWVGRPLGGPRPDVGQFPRLAVDLDRIPRMPEVHDLNPGDRRTRKRALTRPRARRARIVVEGLESRQMLTGGLSLLNRFPLLSLPSVASFMSVHAHDAPLNPGTTNTGATATTTATTSATAANSIVVTGMLGSLDQLDLYRNDSGSLLLSVRLEVTTTAHTPDPARLWLLDGEGNVLADFAPSAGSLCVYVAPDPQKSLFFAVVHGTDFSSSAVVSYRLTVTPVSNLEAETICASGSAAHGIDSTSISPNPPPPPPAPPPPPPPPPPPVSTVPPPVVSPPTTVPPNTGTGSNDVSGTPVGTSSSPGNGLSAGRPSPLLTGDPLVGAFAENATQDSATDDDAGQVDLSRLTVAIMRNAIESEFNMSGSSGGLLSAIVAQSIVGIPLGTTGIPSAYPTLAVPAHALAPTPLNAEETDAALPELGFSSLGPIEGGLSARDRSEAASLPVLTTGAPVLAPSIAAGEMSVGAASVLEQAVNEMKETTGRQSHHNLTAAAALAVNLTSLVLLSAWRPGLVESLKRRLRRPWLRTLTADRNPTLKKSSI
jgi:hypothetical protein